MSPKANESYEFGDFRLDLSQKVLLRDGKPVPLTPKVFDTLEILLEHSGRLLEKDELMQRIWQDHFVEESNLTSNIKTLRKALGDEAANPKYIETVPRRGYRFIADVKESSRHTAAVNGNNRDSSEHIRTSPTAVSVVRGLLFPAVVVFIVALAGTSFWFALRSDITAPILSTPFASEKLSNDGRTLIAVISKDGKMVAYVSGNDRKKQSVWLRQLESGNNVQLLPPSSDDVYRCLALSPDGNSLYFSRAPNVTGASAQLYRVPITGGIPTLIIGDTKGAFSISPSGRRISFVRCIYGSECSLWVADADGRNERKLTSREPPIRIADNQISPDERSIVFAVGQSENAANEFGLVEIDIETGTEREFTTERFFNINHLAWLPDRGGLLITASRIPNNNFPIWYVSAITGEARTLTKDSESYSFISSDEEAATLVTTQFRQDFNVRLFKSEDPKVQPVILGEGTNLSVAPNGNIVLESSRSGNREIWSMGVDSNERRQLTNDAADDRTPVISSDGRRIYFSSNRSGEAQVWRMNADGSNQVQITQKDGGWPILVSADGRWVYYHHGLRRTLWRASTSGGEEEVVFDRASRRFAISSDGSKAAMPEKQTDGNILVIVSLTNGQIVKRLEMADRMGNLVELKWLPEQKGLVYILADHKWENNILWIQLFDEEKPRKVADLGDDEVASFGFAMLPDGKSFVVAQGGWHHDAMLIKGLR